MKQLEFETRHSEFWAQMELFFTELNGVDSSENNIEAVSSELQAQNLKKLNVDEFPQNYRILCQHLAMAKSRRYATGLIARLNSLVQQGYETLYGQSINQRASLLEFLIYGFPASLRSNAQFLWLAAAVFVLPFVAMMVAVMLNDQIIYSVMDASSVRSMESMYDPDLRKFGRERQSSTDIYMFGHYIQNNIGIGFRSFALGIFFGIGSLFILAYNGLVIGAVAGHLTALGFVDTFYPFVVGHGSFELTAIVFSGAAGLKLGFSLLSPGAYTRSKALKIAAKDAIRIMYGVFLMLLIAAFVEAFWSSSSSMPNAIKYSVGGVLWFIVYYYCFFFARTRVSQYQSRYAAQ